MANFKLALVAGHYKGTPGKRCHAEIDPKQTREWELNNRICDKIEAILAGYDGIEVLRIDDTTGERDIPLASRTTAANNWKADFYLSIHHNAAGKKFSGGGIVAYIHPEASQPSIDWQKALYNAAVNATGLRGNRSRPLASSNLHEMRETKMPSVLMEMGFMDSTVDVPIILSEDFADKSANALCDVIIAKSGATKKAQVKTLYRVQIGVFEDKAKAEQTADRAVKAGFSAYIHVCGAEDTQPEPAPAPKPEPKPEPVKEIKAGSRVKVKQGAKTYTGGGLASYVYSRIHVVSQLKGDRAVITYGGVTVCAIHKNSLTLVE